MHEYSIVASLVDRVEREAGGYPGAVVRRLHLRIGELAGVEVELLRTAFETFRERTVCAQSALEIERVAAAWRCTACGGPIERGAPLRCCDRDERLRLAGA